KNASNGVFISFLEKIPGRSILGNRVLKSPRILLNRPLRQLDGLLPLDVAQRLAHLPELIFFDSALEEPGAISIIAAAPREVIRGSSPEEWSVLREKLRARSEAAPRVDDGVPHGMAAGYVEYDGAF